jgi:NOL1/NOP2/fmu family ribosome biogenesis protein
VSNEVIPSRNKILQQNIAKWGCTNSFVTQNDPVDFKRLPGVFDIIVVDAPCSGEGLFRRDPEAAEEWSEKAIELCSARQNQILTDIHESLKPGGFLIYSTCTFENSENSEQVERMISEFGYEFCNSVSPANGIVQSETGYHFYPHKVKGEGLFISMLRKPIDHDKRFRMRKEDPQNYGKDFKSSFSSYFKSDANVSAFVKDDHVYAIPTEHFSLFALLFKNLFIRQAGIFTGTQKDKNFIPSTELALSLVASDEFPSVNVDLQTALTYLRGDSFNLPNAPQGWTIIQYENHNLGWVKVLDRRVNNYYPKEWKIMKR